MYNNSKKRHIKKGGKNALLELRQKMALIRVIGYDNVDSICVPDDLVGKITGGFGEEKTVFKIICDCENKSFEFMFLRSYCEDTDCGVATFGSSINKDDILCNTEWQNIPLFLFKKILLPFLAPLRRFEERMNL